MMIPAVAPMPMIADLSSFRAKTDELPMLK